jgi:hypothetical protein
MEKIENNWQEKPPGARSEITIEMPLISIEFYWT